MGSAFALSVKLAQGITRRNPLKLAVKVVSVDYREREKFNFPSPDLPIQDSITSLSRLRTLEEPSLMRRQIQLENLITNIIVRFQS